MEDPFRRIETYLEKAEPEDRQTIYDAAFSGYGLCQADASDTLNMFKPANVARIGVHQSIPRLIELANKFGLKSRVEGF